MSDTVTIAWTGWYRTTRWCLWEPVATGATEAEAWRMLLDALGQLPGGQSMVLAGDAPPAAKGKQL